MTIRSSAVLPFLQLLSLCVALLLSPVPGLYSDTALPDIATLVFLIGGLPHGAFDIHRVANRARLGRVQLATFLAVYVAMVVLALLLWRMAPSFVLALFLVTAIVHFSEDWPEIKEPLFRIALGFAPICAIGVAHPTEVDAIFSAMAGPVTADVITKIFVLVAPVTLLVSVVGLGVAARDIDWSRPVLFALLIGSLFVLPPLVGFAVFFCLFHTPRHFGAIQSELSGWTAKQFALVAFGISALAVALGVLLSPMALVGGIATAAAGFQLLAAVALPHQSVGLFEKLLSRQTRA
ncbi:Brp/Blh family beta-carotene 15,15'-dioxygenase [Altererythrobacter sp. ZODW24]|uniref:Brp/Blh family beta-carotene 15,15'-dioxygenase n=1 Tax=Altererythrobacter sp. ZODW24 TaxID=2185142 RepID=UPI000DF7F30A|nr:Brp/Blh family beta-carotene 15,15'-dioxygenase [Altererythrobacter sp. ZODW24]